MTFMLAIDEVTERLARKLAQVTGKPLPIVIKEAIETEAARAGVAVSIEPPRDDLLARMTAITDGFALLPVLDPRSADEILGYDDHGVAQ
jgi:antitoxin VapB